MCLVYVYTCIRAQRSTSANVKGVIKGDAWAEESIKESIMKNEE